MTHPFKNAVVLSIFVRRLVAPKPYHLAPSSRHPGLLASDKGKLSIAYSMHVGLPCCSVTNFHQGL